MARFQMRAATHEYQSAIRCERACGAPKFPRRHADRRQHSERNVHERQFNRQWTIALIIASILIVEIAYGLYKGRDSFLLPRVGAAAAAAVALGGNSEQVGAGLYTAYLLPFEIASILLLVAIVGAVVLSKKRTPVE